MPPRLPPPILGENLIIPPRQPGETPYAYRNRRSLALTGETLYERRQRLGRERGLGARAAAGHAREQEERRARAIRVQQQTGVSPGQLAWAYARNWLISNGFTPETTGASWTYLHQMEPSLRGTYARARSDTGKITPEMVHEAIQLEQTEDLEPGWALARIRAKLYAMIEYQDNRNRQPGHDDWDEFLQVHPFLPQLAIQWWYYH